MPTQEEHLARLLDLDGLVLAGLSRDAQSPPERLGGSGELVALAASTAEFLRAQRALLDDLQAKPNVEDAVLTLPNHHYLCRPLRHTPERFLFVLLDRNRANLALARLLLSQYEQSLAG
jgi:hypothetical protein